MSSDRTCCDEAGWQLDEDGTPVEPATPCRKHHGKRTTQRSQDGAPVSDSRVGNKQKFAWIYAVAADTGVQPATKVVAITTALKMAGHKGFFKTTRRAVASLCGTSQTTVKRAFNELAQKRYIDAHLTEGAASTYHLIYPETRWEDWLDAENEYTNAVCRWLDAEVRHINSWLAAESSFIAGDSMSQTVDGDDWSSDGPGSGHIEQGVGPPTTRGRATYDPGSGHLRPGVGSQSSCQPAQTTKPISLLSLSKEPERFLKDSENDPTLRGPLHAAPPRESPNTKPTAGECSLCGPDGLFRDTDGYPAVLITDDAAHEYPVECQHSLAANLTEIQCQEKALKAGIARTGWPEIDAVYGYDDDALDDDTLPRD